MKISRYKNYRFNFHLNDVKIIVSSTVKYEYLDSVDKVQIDVWFDKNSSEEESSLQEFERSKYGKLLKMSPDELYRNIVICAFTTGVVDYIIDHNTPTLHISVPGSMFRK